jgi:MinD superfamily P-loop ATPase
MFNLKRRERIVRTNYIEFDANKCQACWDCLSACKNNVIGKIDVFFHKHARIVKPNMCKGCMKCVKACSHTAFTPLLK